MTISKVLNVNPGLGGTTIQADLTDAKQIPSNIYDCAILTFTVQFILMVQRRSTHSDVFCARGECYW
ncbi:MAG: hypothetical protein QM771_13615 [Nitrospira sp.]